MNYLTGAAVMATVLASAYAEETSPVGKIAMDFLARASSTSEVLTLNLTNLIILLVLKALIFGFGLFSFGNTKSSYSSHAQYERARSGTSDVSTISQSDVTGGLCFMMYISGAEEKVSCLQRTACEDPKTATDYLTAAKMWWKMHKLVNSIPFGASYYDTMKVVEEATQHSVAGGDCSIYKW